jgi:hypothetical protein
MLLRWRKLTGEIENFKIRKARPTAYSVCERRHGWLMVSTGFTRVARRALKIFVSEKVVMGTIWMKLALTFDTLQGQHTPIFLIK